MQKVKAELGVSERRACQVLGQHRSTQRKPPRTPDDEAQLTADIVALAKRYGRYGYRRITALLRSAGWAVNAKRVQRIWRREGLKVPQKQPKRGRLWLNDGSCVRLRACWPNHVWSYDFVEARTHDGRKFRMLCLIDEFTREALAIRVKRKLNSTDVLEVLADVMICRGTPQYIRSDNGPEFIALALRKWIADVGTQTAYIEPGSPWENGYCESFNSKLRDELLNLEVFYSLREAEVLIEAWRRHFNTVRPHSSLGYLPPAPEAVLPRSGNLAPWPGAPAGGGARRADCDGERAPGQLRRGAKAHASLTFHPDHPMGAGQAHEANDETLERVYIGRRFRNDTERLEKLFEMYSQRTRQIEPAGAEAQQSMLRLEA